MALRLIDIFQILDSAPESGQKADKTRGTMGTNCRPRVVATRATDMTIVLSLRGVEPVHSREMPLPFTRDDIGTRSIFDGRPEYPPIKSEPLNQLGRLGQIKPLSVYFST